MTREQAKAVLIASGVAEPTDAQISNLLDSVTAETKKEKDKADKLKEKADKADELQKQLDEISEKDMSEAEKANKALEDAQAQIKELTSNSFKSEAKAILKGAGLEDADIEALIPGMIADTLESTQARANAYVSTVNKVRENAIKEHDKDVLDKTKTPGADQGGNDNKTEAEKVAESIGKEIGGSSKDAASIISAYTN